MRLVQPITQAVEQIAFPWDPVLQHSLQCFLCTSHSITHCIYMYIQRPRRNRVNKLLVIFTAPPGTLPSETSFTSGNTWPLIQFGAPALTHSRVLSFFHKNTEALMKEALMKIVYSLKTSRRVSGTPKGLWTTLWKRLSKTIHLLKFDRQLTKENQGSVSKEKRRMAVVWLPTACKTSLSSETTAWHCLQDLELTFHLSFLLPSRTMANAQPIKLVSEPTDLQSTTLSQNPYPLLCLQDISLPSAFHLHLHQLIPSPVTHYPFLFTLFPIPRVVLGSITVCEILPRLGTTSFLKASRFLHQNSCVFGDLILL